MLCKGETPLQQIARRLKVDLKFDDSDLDTVSMKNIDSMRLDKHYYRDDFINLRKYEAQYMVLKTTNYLINCMDNKNDCVILRDGQLLTYTVLLHVILHHML